LAVLEADYVKVVSANHHYTLMINKAPCPTKGEALVDFRSGSSTRTRLRQLPPNLESGG